MSASFHVTMGDADTAFAAIGLLHPPPGLCQTVQDQATFQDAAREVLENPGFPTLKRCPSLYRAMCCARKHGMQEWCFDPVKPVTPVTKIDLLPPISWAVWWLGGRLGNIPLTEAHDAAQDAIWQLAGAVDWYLEQDKSEPVRISLGQYINDAWRSLIALGPVFFMQVGLPAAEDPSSAPPSGAGLRLVSSSPPEVMQ